MPGWKMIARPKGPPLNALRAFEAAARLESFAAAAEELSVTTGAVAQQIKSLEAWIGTELFERQAQGVILSSLGREVKPRFVQAFDSLSEAVQSLQIAVDPNHIRIAALPAVAQLWLSVVLPIVRGRYPELNVSVTALETKPNLDRAPFDLAIFYDERGESSQRQVLTDDTIFPVSSPKLAKSILCPEDLAGLVLLKDDQWSDDWNIWLSEHLPTHKLEVRSSIFSLYSLAVEEAKSGAGILMGHRALIEPLLKSGELFRLFSQETVLPRCLTLTVSAIGAANASVNKVVQLLLDQKDKVCD
jgi:LysR family transcriptional regulator, glycine cleavage system transcriptional activator